MIGQAERETSRAATPEEVAAIRASMAESLSRGSQQSGSSAPGEHSRPAAPDFEGHKIKTFHSVDGWEILVGENATSNDYLTTKIASPVRHLAPCPGRHFRARRHPGAEPPRVGLPRRLAASRRNGGSPERSQALVTHSRRLHPEKICPQTPQKCAGVGDVSEREDSVCGGDTRGIGSPNPSPQ